MKLRFELIDYDARVLDEYEDEKTDMEIGQDIENFNEFVQAVKNNYGIEEIDDYRYEVENLSEEQFDLIILALDVLQEEFEVCSVNWDEIA